MAATKARAATAVGARRARRRLADGSWVKLRAGVIAGVFSIRLRRAMAFLPNAFRHRVARQSARHRFLNRKIRCDGIFNQGDHQMVNRP